MKLVEFELFKIRKNNYFIITLCVFACILFGCCIAYFSNSKDFLTEQHKEARVMNERISENLNIKDENIIKERDLYRELSYVNTWEEAYEVLNAIDQLFIDAPYIVEKNTSDLNYDFATNIEIRNYQSEHNLNPDDKSGGMFIIEMCNKILNYLIPVLLFIISAYVFVMEYEDKTMTYLFTLHYRRSHIVISKWVAACISCAVIVVLPLCVLFLAVSVIYGFGNPNALTEVSRQYAQIFVNNYGFITLNNALFYVTIIIGFNIILIASITSLFTSLFKKYLFIFLAIGSTLFMGFNLKIIIPVSNVLASSINIHLQWMIGIILSLLALWGAITYLNKRSILP